MEELERVEVAVFDVGETLVDETRAWAAHADEVGLTRLTLFAALGALIERGSDHREVWDLLGVDAPAIPVPIRSEDLYPDAVSSLLALDRIGIRQGIAGNQPEAAELALTELRLPVAFIASSSRWQVAKPSPEFFPRVIAQAGSPAEEIVYIGDRLDNDILPAQRAGMRTIFIRRGPWGHLHASRPEAARADAVIDSLNQLPSLLRPRRP